DRIRVQPTRRAAHLRHAGWRWRAAFDLGLFVRRSRIQYIAGLVTGGAEDRVPQPSGERDAPDRRRRPGARRPAADDERGHERGSELGPGRQASGVLVKGPQRWRAVRSRHGEWSNSTLVEGQRLRITGMVAEVAVDNTRH